MIRLSRKSEGVMCDPRGGRRQRSPQAAGWFVVNARDAPWFHNELGGYCGFEGRDDAAFDELGINLNMLLPGKPMAMYHEEPGQEGFLVLRGECLLIVEGEERPLRAWDFFHCPSHTKHVLVGAGNEPALVLAVDSEWGSRPIRSTRRRYDMARASIEPTCRQPRHTRGSRSPNKGQPRNCARRRSIDAPGDSVSCSSRRCT